MRSLAVAHDVSSILRSSGLDSATLAEASTRICRTGAGLRQADRSCWNLTAADGRPLGPEVNGRASPPNSIKREFHHE
jgi:hypothetical protein